MTSSPSHVTMWRQTCAQFSVPCYNMAADLRPVALPMGALPGSVHIVRPLINISFSASVPSSSFIDGSRYRASVERIYCILASQYPYGTFDLQRPASCTDRRHSGGPLFLYSPQRSINHNGRLNNECCMVIFNFNVTMERGVLREWLSG